MLTLDQLEAAVKGTSIDTVVVAFADMQGRLVGKRVAGEHFVDADVARHGVEGCTYLLTVDMEMDPVPGYALANWDRGYGDFVLKPDLATLRRIPWLEATALAEALPELLVERARQGLQRLAMRRRHRRFGEGVVDRLVDAAPVARRQHAELVQQAARQRHLQDQAGQAERADRLQVDALEGARQIVAGIAGAEALVRLDGNKCLVAIVSSAFEGQRPVKKQQLVYGCLNDLIASGELHAVSMHTYTPSEWATQKKLGIPGF